MPSETKTLGKDIWDVVQICAQTAIALVALVFTILFGVKQQKNAEATLQLAASNYEVAKVQTQISAEQMNTAKAQVKSALLPSLSSADPKQRDLAMYFAKALDERFAIEVATVFALHDRDQGIRNTAIATLTSLTQSQQSGIKAKAKQSLDKYDVITELRSTGLLNKLADAQNFIKGENVSGKEAALVLYREVVNKLSSSARNKLDPTLLNDAEKADREGHIDAAVGKYRALFAS